MNDFILITAIRAADAIGVRSVGVPWPDIGADMLAI
jgi:hypothetical protein